ncbi:MAG: hydroxymethylbilane synthase [Candidatus Gracilibacteria bacterium]|nr:hydroxymethylbilane synthase [Candidatus Gracilibacteria bacterium]
MQKTIRIGTRESKLAIWQAEFVKTKIEENGHECELVLIKSDGDVNQMTPIYEMGIEGVFTKTLDMALLNNQIDIAVHSLKDVPTKLPKGITLAGIPERGDYRDLLIHKGDIDFLNEQSSFTVATSSLRRKAQILNKYPSAQVEDLRGNIQKRLDKLENNNHWNAAVFAKTAIDRLELDIENKLVLDWMLPAPAQGALGVACLEIDKELIEICELITDENTKICTEIERGFLTLLMGGCSVPIGALAIIDGEKITFKGNILSIDGKQKYEVEVEEDKSNYKTISKIAANRLLEKDEVRSLLASFKKN